MSAEEGPRFAGERSGRAEGHDYFQAADSDAVKFQWRFGGGSMSAEEGPRLRVFVMSLRGTK
jgi:hypothetical protein